MGFRNRLEKGIEQWPIASAGLAGLLGGLLALLIDAGLLDRQLGEKLQAVLKLFGLL